MKHYFIVGIFSLLLLFWIFGSSKEVGTSIASTGEIASSTSLTDQARVAGTTTSFDQEIGQEEAIATSSPVTHSKTPNDVKAIYMSSWVASTPSVRDKLVAMIDTTELNAVVIDVKDNTGAITWEERMKRDDLRDFIRELHEKHIYVIGRIAVFQDDAYAHKHRDQAVQKSDGSLWKSRKGESWVDTGSREMWDFVAELGKEAYGFGFDEINLDYIRFSTEGTKDNLIFPKSGARGHTDRVSVVSEFYAYVTGEFRKEGIPVSGDVFGIITTATKDIPVLGQDLHKALTYFDYVAPMVYPSHYAPGTFGFSNPADHPKEIIREAMKGALLIADEVASSTGQATSSVRAKLRPWYQDFNMGATYTKEMVRGQIEAGYGLGVTSWMLWDPGNSYTRGALKGE